jgi:MerR family transcriptional regulator, light-induced transcriptional regulator
MALQAPHASAHVRGEWDADSHRAWNGTASDFALVLDQGGTVRGLGCSRDDLWCELGGAKAWLGQPWASVATPEAQAVVGQLLQDAAAGRFPGWHLVTHNGSGGRPVPMLCSAVRSGTHVVVCGRDLGSLDFTSVLREHEAAVACAHADVLLNRGVGMETLLLDVLAPAARRLGDLWAQDICTFVDVTTGLGHLHEVLHALDPGERISTPSAATGSRILLAPCPGEQHTFGLAVVARLFRRAGWQVRQERRVSNAVLVQATRRYWFDVVGLSASCEDRLDVLAETIHTMRRGSRNPTVRVLVGGSLFTCRPELAALVGADATAFDGRQAVRQAQRLLGERSTAS